MPHWNLFHKAQPKIDCSESVEDDTIIEINALYDREQNFDRIGDKHASLIIQDARHKLAREYMEQGNIATLNMRSNRWEKFRGK